MMLISIHPETPPCHSEPCDRLRINSAKNLCGSSNYEILRRLAPQNDTHIRGFRMDGNYCAASSLINLGVT